MRRGPAPSTRSATRQRRQRAPAGDARRRGAPVREPAPDCVRRAPRRDRAGPRAPARGPQVPPHRRPAARRSSARRAACTPSRNASSAFSSSAGASETCAAAGASIPIHITGAIAGSASRFAGRATSETRPKWNDISGAVATRRGDRQRAPRVRERLGQRARARRVSGGHEQRRCPTTAAKLSCQPTSCHARGSSASVTRPREQQRVPARRRPAGERGATPAAPITPARMDRRPGAGERHVDGDQRQRSPSAAPRRPRPSARQQRPGERAPAATTFWPLTASTCARPERLKSSRRALGDVLVLAQHHPACERRQRRREPAPTPASARRRIASTAPGEAAAPRAGGPTRARAQDHVDARSPQVGGVVERVRRAGAPGSSSDPRRDQLVADRTGRRAAHARGTRTCTRSPAAPPPRAQSTAVTRSRNRRTPKLVRSRFTT